MSLPNSLVFSVAFFALVAEAHGDIPGGRRSMPPIPVPSPKMPRSLVLEPDERAKAFRLVLPAQVLKIASQANGSRAEAAERGRMTMAGLALGCAFAGAGLCLFRRQRPGSIFLASGFLVASVGVLGCGLWPTPVERDPMDLAEVKKLPVEYQGHADIEIAPEGQAVKLIFPKDLSNFSDQPQARGGNLTIVREPKTTQPRLLLGRLAIPEERSAKASSFIGIAVIMVATLCLGGLLLMSTRNRLLVTGAIMIVATNLPAWADMPFGRGGRNRPDFRGLEQVSGDLQVRFMPGSGAVYLILPTSLKSEITRERP